jgi:hypothetical protein
MAIDVSKINRPGVIEKDLGLGKTPAKAAERVRRHRAPN